jgi:HEAT repeat protein
MARPASRIAPLALALLGLATVGCANHIGTTARSFMLRVREEPDPNIRHLAYSKLANPGCYDGDADKAEAALLLASKLDERSEPPITRAVICRTLGELRRPEARESLHRACDDPEPAIRAAACRALGAIGDGEDAPVLARIMAADQDADCRIAAVEGLGAMRAGDPRALVVLADGMENPDPAIRVASYEALRRITGRDLGPEPKPWRDLAGTATAPDEPEAARR